MGYNGTYNDDQITGLTTMEDVERPVMLNSASDVQADFGHGSLDGKLTFVLPSQNNKGESLNGAVNYRLLLDGTETAQGSGDAGSTIQKDITVSTPGIHRFTVSVSQNDVSGDDATLSMWVGNDYPVAPNHASATSKANGDDAATVSVKWDKVSKGRHNGYVDTAQMKYHVFRMPDSLSVYNGSDTTFTETVTTEKTRQISYKVWAESSSLMGDTATTNSVKVGSAYDVPYSENFNDDASFSEWTVVDANKDGSTWTRGDGYLQYQANSSNAADDYAITPGLRMKKGNLYNVSFTAINSYPTEKVALYMGKKPTAEDMTEVIIAPTDITYQPRQHSMSGSFHAPEDGVYYLGLKACSDADMSTLYVENFSVSEVPATAPARPDSITVTPGEKGALSATISFKAPDKTIGGDKLTSIDAVVVQRDGTEIYRSATSPAPGEKVTVTDDGSSLAMTAGEHTYNVYAISGGTPGDYSTVSSYIGEDTPGAVRMLKAVENLDHPGKILVSWQAPEKGKHGGYVNPDNLSYTVSVGTSGREETTSKPEYTDSVDISKGQTYQGYSVYATNSVGSGRNFWKTVTAIAGPADIAPMAESFPNVTMKSGPWLPEMLKGDIGDAYWTPCDGVNTFCGTQDKDAGVLTFSTTGIGKSSRIQSPKIDISKLQSPRLTLWIYNTGKGDSVTLSVSPDYGPYTELQKIDLSGEPGWQRISCDLSPWKQTGFIRIGVAAESVKSSTDITALDNFAVSEAKDIDLGVMSLEALPKGVAGNQSKLLLKVRNWGNVEVAGPEYKVNVYKNDKYAFSVGGVDVDVDGTASVVLPDTLRSIDASNTSYYAQIVYSDDENMSNNTSSKVYTEVIKNTFPVPTAVTAKAADEGAQVQWQAPDLSTSPLSRTTDGFDDYEAFATSGYGDWKVVDGDKANTIRITLTGLSAPLSYPHAGEPMSFQVFNTEEAGIPFSSWTPHSGSQMLVAFKCASADGGKTETANNDWLISPELNGEAQELSFYAKTGMGGDYTPESFEILYSTTTSDTAAFHKIGETHDIYNVKDWQEIREQLPEGSRYFAIRCVSKSKFALLLDDITYTAKDAAQEKLILTNYLVYRDSTYLTRVPAESTDYVDPTAKSNGHYNYQVSALYTQGESPLSDPASVTVTAIDGARISGVQVTVAQHAILFRGLQGRTVQVFNAAGASVATITGKDAYSLSVNPGMYIVKIDNMRPMKLLAR